MPKRSPLPNSCMLARSLELLGEWWTLLIVRDAFFGIRHFEEFQASLGIARNVLSLRLTKLVEAEVLTRKPDATDGRRIEYRLTAKGRALLPIIVGLAQWGARHLREDNQPLPYWFAERATGERIAPIAVLGIDGRELEARDLAIVEGPGMTDEIRAIMPALTRPEALKEAA